MSLPFSTLLSKDTSRVTTKDPVTPSLKSCVSHSDRGLPGDASSVDVSVFTITCRPGLFGCASLPASGTVISSSASSATHGIRFYRITICTPTASAAPFPSINTSPGASSRSTTTPSGSRIIVDRVVRYENLTDERGEIFTRLNIPFDGDLGARKKGHFRTDRTPYQLVFSPQQRQIVERVFAREIQLHGYRFAQAFNLEAMVNA